MTPPHILAHPIRYKYLFNMKDTMLDPLVPHGKQLVVPFDRNNAVWVSGVIYIRNTHGLLVAVRESNKQLYAVCILSVFYIAML